MTSNNDIIKALKKQYRAIKIEPASIERNRAKLLAHYQEKFPSINKDLFFYLKPAFVAVVALFFFVFSSTGLVVYAQKSLPGSNFYAIKKIYEKVTFILTPASQKPVLRAEMVAKRFNEFKDLVDRDNEKISSAFLQEATNNLEKEISALKQELKNDETKNIIVSDLPILDNKKIIKILKNPEIDINKILAETREAIKDKNLQIATEKIGEMEKIFSETIIEEEIVEPKQSIENLNQTSSEKNISIQPEIKIEPVIIKPVAPVLTTPTDFTIDVNFEKSNSIEK